MDVASVGAPFILTESSVGVFGSLGHDVLTLLRSPSLGAKIFGVWLVCIGLNYIPLLNHAISLVRHGTAFQEIADEMSDRKRMFRKYRRQSVLLLGRLSYPFWP